MDGGNAQCHFIGPSDSMIYVRTRVVASSTQKILNSRQAVLVERWVTVDKGTRIRSRSPLMSTTGFMHFSGVKESQEQARAIYQC